MKTALECKCFEAIDRIMKTHNEQHCAPKSLARKFNEFRQKHGSGSGQDYWEGLERIAEGYYKDNPPMYL
ncbi:MAG: hypothetical protein DDT19_01140 [Syntrophomonadaceae bacterium]|nr:hypothetical protein [Bacillota bacterium]